MTLEIRILLFITSTAVVVFGVFQTANTCFYAQTQSSFSLGYLIRWFLSLSAVHCDRLSFLSFVKNVQADQR